MRPCPPCAAGEPEVAEQTMTGAEARLQSKVSEASQVLGHRDHGSQTGSRPRRRLEETREEGEGGRCRALGSNFERGGTRGSGNLASLRVRVGVWMGGRGARGPGGEQDAKVRGSISAEGAVGDWRNVWRHFIASFWLPRVTSRSRRSKGHQPKATTCTCACAGRFGHV